MSNSFGKRILNKKNTQKKYGKFKYITLSLLMIIALLSTSYAIFTVSLKGKTKYSLTIGKLDFSIDNEQNSIRLMNAYPMSDEEGQALKPYTFSLTNTGTTKEYYKISLITDTVGQASCDRCTFLSPTELRYSLTVDDVVTAPKKAAKEKTLEIGELSVGQTKKYELRLWLNSEATIEEENKYYYGKIKVDASQEKELYKDESGANPPELTSGMIPVIYDESTKTWEKADVTDVWYDYDNQVWANAVTVTEDTRASYMAADAGEPILMDDINTMWAWIPRYEYNYLNLGTSVASGEVASGEVASGEVASGETATGEGDPEIKINFISIDTITPSNSSLYRIPEGFKFGDENIPGFWMGKFETSTLERCIAAFDSVNTDCDLTTLTPQVKPNVTSWRGARISTFFEASRLMQSEDNASIYGFDAVGTSSMDTHMLKNTEWGIVAMLSQSKYGKYGNENYTGADKEVAINNCSSYITGIGGDTVSADESSTTCTTNTYETSKGQAASTTGTIYGVYDMDGGSYEYVMGNYNNISGFSTSYNSGFCGTNGPTEKCREWPNAKYFDLYTSDNASEGYKFGDATYETHRWYSGNLSFAFSDKPWFVRGGQYKNSYHTGVFSTFSDDGISASAYASRFVIKP